MPSRSRTLFSSVRLRRAGRVVAVGAVGALGVTGVTMLPASAQPVAASGALATAADSKPAVVTERPDETSARITARIQGSRVEITDDRTENTTTWANPDGTLSTDSSLAPVRARAADGSWKPVDYDLVATDGGFAPKSSPVDVWFSGGGISPAAVAKKGDRQLDLSMDKPSDVTVVGSWAAKLPAPVVKDNTATYQLNDTVSLVLTATGAGMEESIVLADRPATADLDGVLDQFHLRTALTGLAAHDAGDGVAFTKPTAATTEAASSDPVITAGATTVFDSQTDTDGAPSNAVTVPTTLTPDPTTDAAQALGVTDASGTAPDALTSYLSDPATVYPVTIDPAISVVAASDTWIQQNDASSHGGDGTLKVGYASSSERRALLRFPLSRDGFTASGATVSSATLKLFQSGGSTCTAEPINVYPLTTSWGPAATWANPPTATSTNMASASFSHGYSSTSCPAAYGTVDVTAMVNAWANGTPNYGLEVRAANETATVQDKTFCAVNLDPSPSVCDTTTHQPVLSITYDHAPAAPAAPTINTSPASSAGYSIKTTPVLRGSISDPDANAHVVATVKNTAGTVVWTATSGTLNGTFAFTVPAGKLVDGTTYTATAAAADGTFTKTSPVQTFTVDTTPPTTSVTSTHYTTGGWNTAAPVSDVFTLRGSADTKSFAYSLNGAAAKIVAAGSSGTASFTWKPVNGPNTIAVTALDKGGNIGKSLLGFGAGPAGITQLVDHPVSTGTFPLQASGPVGATGTTISWRFAGDTAWTDVDPRTLTPADGSTWSGIPAEKTVAGGTTAASATPALMWDATAQTYPGSDGNPVHISAPALIDLQVCFTYAAGTKLCAVENGAQLVPSAFGGNFPTTDMGPAQVALTTGEMALSESDAADQTAGMGRTFSSYDPGTITDGPFGPGWSTSLDASSDSAATLVDDRAQDGTFVLVTAGDASQVYTPTSSSGTFVPLGVDDQSRLQLSPDGQTVTLTHPQQEDSTWTYNAGDASWEFQDSEDLVDGTSTTVTADADHEWIVETKPGDSAACTASEQEPGCRALRVNYTGTGTATRATSVDLITGAAGGTGTVTRQATYSYTGTGAAALLTKVCGPDPDGTGTQTPLCETYTYDTTTVAGRTLLATLTPPGQAKWTFTYDSQGRLAKVTRPQDSDAGGGTATWSTDYDVNPTGTGLPDLSATATAVWGQTDLPTHGYAAFDPSYTPSGTPTTADLKHASLWYTDAEGNTTNTATYGTATDTTNGTRGTPTSRWLIDATTYDNDGNTTATIDPAGIIASQDTQTDAVAGGASNDVALAAAQQVARDRSSWEVYSGDGSRVSDEYGPAHDAFLKDGTEGTYRTHTHYVYDDQAPNLGGARTSPPTTPPPTPTPASCRPRSTSSWRPTPRPPTRT